MPELVAGDIGCTVKLKDVKTGNTLNGKDCENRFNFIKYPNAKYSRAIKPVNEADVEKMMVILNRMREEDPTWEVEQSKELKQTIVHGQGEFHLRTLKWRLENNENCRLSLRSLRFLIVKQSLKQLVPIIVTRNNQVVQGNLVRFISLLNLIMKECLYPKRISLTVRNSR